MYPSESTCNMGPIIREPSLPSSRFRDRYRCLGATDLLLVDF